MKASVGPDATLDDVFVYYSGSPLQEEGSYRDVRYTLPERPLLPGDVPGERALAPVASGRLRRAPLR